jgi:hypothetical protein
VSILSKWTSRTRPYADRALEEKYTQMICLLPTGMTLEQIRRKVKEAIKVCRKTAIREGTIDHPTDYGEFLILSAQSGDARAKEILDKARREGATSEDIRDFWSLDDLERRMIKFYEDTLLSAMLRSLWKPGLPEHLEKEIESEVRKTWPVYGDPHDSSLGNGDDRPLPYELRNRVERWRTRFICEKDGERLRVKAHGYSTFNALVRAEIRQGTL